MDRLDIDRTVTTANGDSSPYFGSRDNPVGFNIVVMDGMVHDPISSPELTCKHTDVLDTVAREPEMLTVFCGGFHIGHLAPNTFLEAVDVVVKAGHCVRMYVLNYLRD